MSFGLLLSGLLLLGVFIWWANAPVGLSRTPLDVRILPGSGLRQVMAQLQAQGVSVQPTAFQLLARWEKVDQRLQAGSYEFHAGISPRELLLKMARGERVFGTMSWVEGGRFSQWRTQLQQHPHLQQTVQDLDADTIARQIGIPRLLPEAEMSALQKRYPGAPLEGWLAPDTYQFDRYSSDLELLRRAYQLMQQRLDKAWTGRASGLPYRTPYEALVMASIIEKETGQPADRPMVAAVFVNRLKLGMRLQTDPTVIYGVGESFDGNLRRSDLQTDTPYNSYRRAGLPPTPIAMPSLAALEAAMHPAKSEALYFVARGDGSSEFSETLEAHNRAVNRYQRGTP